MVHLPFPKNWSSHVQLAVLHVIALTQHAPAAAVARRLLRCSHFAVTGTAGKLLDAAALWQFCGKNVLETSGNQCQGSVVLLSKLLSLPRLSRSCGGSVSASGAEGCRFEPCRGY